MNRVQLASVVIQTVATAVIAGTLVVYARQLRAMKRQADVMERAAQTQNFLALIGFLQNEDARASRRVVIEEITKHNISWPDWSPSQREHAARVCSTYDIAAVMVRDALVPLEPVLQTWGPSIRNCYVGVGPFIREMQKPENSGPTYWDDFVWLHDRALEWESRAAGLTSN